MLTEKIINDICTKRNMIKMSISSIPTWVDKTKREGIEFHEVGQKIRPFWNKSGERIYGEPESDFIQKTIALIMVEKIGDNNEAEKTQKTKEDKEQVQGNDKELVNTLLPEFLTPALMTKWSQMSTTDRILLFQKTPTDKIKYVAVGKDDTGKIIKAPYIEGNYMFREANASFLFDWYLSDIVITTCATGVGVTGKLNCWFTEYNKYLSRPATGYQELNKKVDIELAKKGATTDAIKKGLSLFGFNSDVYGGERD